MTAARFTKVFITPPSATGMTPSTVTTPDAEAALTAFASAMPAEEGLQLRTLAHAWTLGGGTFSVGKVAVRLVGGKDGFTAGTLYAARGEQPARLELCRVLLEKHGVPDDKWGYWVDEFADLGHHGFVATAKYPALSLGPHVTATELARLVSGLRDLAAMTV